ncbi:MAG TPA: hypothetical protein VF607_00015, partial [Verrucomicrobiae bacterium]
MAKRKISLGLKLVLGTLLIIQNTINAAPVLGILPNTYTIIHNFTQDVDFNGQECGPVGLSFVNNQLVAVCINGGAYENGAVVAMNLDGTGYKVWHSMADGINSTIQDANSLAWVGGESIGSSIIGYGGSTDLANLGASDLGDYFGAFYICGQGSYHVMLNSTNNGVPQSPILNTSLGNF